MKQVYMQFGCGLSAPDDWLNFDASPTLRVQRIPLLGKLVSVKPQFPKSVKVGNIVNGLALGPKSCTAIYCSHVLEHLALHDFRKTLKNVFEYLILGGRFRFVVPDLEFLAKEYVESADAQAALRFMERTYLGMHDRRRGVMSFLRRTWGNSKHLWMWDYKSVAKELESIGFRSVRRAEYGDAGDPAFNGVEDPQRWENCLGVECFRPKMSYEKCAA